MHVSVSSLMKEVKVTSINRKYTNGRVSSTADLHLSMNKACSCYICYTTVCTCMQCMCMHECICVCVDECVCVCTKDAPLHFLNHSVGQVISKLLANN